MHTEHRTLKEERVKNLIVCIFSVSILFGTVYEGTTLDLGIEIDERSTESSELLDNPFGTDYRPPPEPLDPSTLADPNDPSSAFEYQTPIERALSHEEEGPVWAGYDWADDVLVYGGRVGSGQDFDYDEDTGYLYAVYDTDHATGDSLVCMCSTDGGDTWSFFGYATNNDNEISNPRIVVAKDYLGMTWVVIMGIWHEAGDDVLWTRRWLTNGGSATYEQVASDVKYADLAADIGTGAWLYATYVPDDGSYNIRTTRHKLPLGIWESDGLIMSNTEVTSYPAIAAATGGQLGVAYIDGRLAATPQVRVKMSTTYGASWIASAQVSNTTADALLNTAIAFTHGGTDAAWISVTYDFYSSNDNVGYYYNTGPAWVYGGTFPGSGGNENRSSLGTRKITSTGEVALSYNVDPGDSVMLTSAGAWAPTSFSTPVRINDFPGTDAWPACAGWNGDNNESVLYTNWNNNYRLMYDWYNHTTGIDDAPGVISMLSNAPNPFNATTNISFTLTQSSPVTIAVYNVAGQLVSTVADNQSFTEGSHSVQWDGRNLSPGLYFCRVNSNGISRTHRMLHVKS